MCMWRVVVDDNTGPETPTLDKGVRTQPTYPAPYDRGSEATYSSHTVPYTLVYCVYTHFLSVYSMLFIICINTLILHLYSPPPPTLYPLSFPFPPRCWSSRRWWRWSTTSTSTASSGQSVTLLLICLPGNLMLSNMRIYMMRWDWSVIYVSCGNLHTMFL